MHEFLVHTDGLTVGYRGIPLIRDITLHVRRGEILTLIGPNGAGKSTILKSIIRQLTPLGGTVCLDGRDMSGMHERAIAQRLSVLMTGRSRPELMTCGEVAAAGRYPYTGRLGILSAADRAKVHEAMALVHAEALYDRSFNEISDGQRQRVLLARAICQEPEVIVLDEPTSFLDIRYKAELLTILKRLVREKQIALILSLHEIDLAQKISDRIVCIRSHAVDRCGTPEEIFSGGYLERLYGMTAGSFDEHYGGIELAAVPGPPRVFVIGGGGSGIPAYRRLQRQGIPFAAGILHENDLDCPAARALAAQVITEQAWQPVRPQTIAQAKAVIDHCAQVLCCVPAFGPLNDCNRLLAEYAGSRLTAVTDST